MSRVASTADRAVRLGVHQSTRWSTRVELVVTDPGVVVAAVRVLDGVLDRVEAAASRFRDDSEVCRLHRSADGTPQPVSPDLAELLEVALRAAARTGGAVDPTVGGALCRLGYDRDLSDLRSGVAGAPPDPAPVPGWASVVLDRTAGTVALPADTLLDLGATAKAWAADRAAREIATRLDCGALVSLGGDLAVDSAPTGGFTVAVADVCGDPDAPTAVSIRSGGLATSGVGNRHWLLGDRRVHHLVDPATGLPVTGPWRTVTVAAASCTEANTASTAAVVLGTAAPDWLGSRGLPSRLVSHDGTVTTVAGWPADPPDAAGAGARR